MVSIYPVPPPNIAPSKSVVIGLFKLSNNLTLTPETFNSPISCCPFPLASIQTLSPTEAGLKKPASSVKLLSLEYITGVDTRGTFKATISESTPSSPPASVVVIRYPAGTEVNRTV